MKSFGREFLLTITLVVGLLGLAGGAHAAITAEVDRYQIALGDTVKLTLLTTDGDELSDIRLDSLETDFQVLQRASSSNISIVNGSRSHEKKLIVTLAPRREGSLTIPALRSGKNTTRPISLLVAAAPAANTSGQEVIFTAEVDSKSVYVQSQILLTLRIQQAIELDGRSISELELDNAFVKALEQKTFQRRSDGRNWLVHEVRYAIFPEQSGTLQIPEQVFSGRLREGRRSFFNSGGGRQMQRKTDALSIEVLPRPQQFNTGDWLAARQVKVEERWSTPPEQLRAGESATRTIQIVGEGVQGAQLPPILLEPIDGLKFYPDQAEITEQEVSSGLLGVRRDSTAVVPTRAGTWSLPEMRIPWWDTQTDQLRYAVLPGRSITVAAADPSTTTPPTELANPAIAATSTLGQGNSNVLLWQALTAFSVSGWILTAVYFWRRKSRQPTQEPAAQENVSERRSFKNLQEQCTKEDPIAARSAMIAWASALLDAPLASTQQVADHFNDEALTQALQALDSCLYGSSLGSDSETKKWRGDTLLKCCTALRDKHKRDRSTKKVAELQLYPQ